MFLGGEKWRNKDENKKEKKSSAQSWKSRGDENETQADQKKKTLIQSMMNSKPRFERKRFEGSIRIY